jgi:hypothetical protein
MATSQKKTTTAAATTNTKKSAKKSKDGRFYFTREGVTILRSSTSARALIADGWHAVAE